MATKLFSSSDEPTSSRHAIATCPISMAVRRRDDDRRLIALPGAAPSTRPVRRSTRPACHAGHAPNARLASRDAATANSSEGRSSAMSDTRGKSAGSQATSIRTRIAASTRPRHAPIAPITRFSISNWRASRAVPAPMAARTAISCRRAAARATWSAATFAVAAASRSRTAASSTWSPSRTPPVTASRIGSARILGGPSVPKTASAAAPPPGTPRAREVASAEAWATVAPGFRRATALNIWIHDPPLGVAAGRTWYGIQPTVSRSGNAKSGRSTPATT